MRDFMSNNPQRKYIYERYGQGAEWAKKRSQIHQADDRNWKALLQAMLTEGVLNDINVPVIQSFMDESYTDDIPNRINGVIKYMLDMSAEMLMNAISLTAIAENTKSADTVNPLSYNPKSFDDKYLAHIDTTTGDYAGYTDQIVEKTSIASVDNDY